MSIFINAIDIKEILTVLKELQLYLFGAFEIFNKEGLIESVNYFNSFYKGIRLKYC